MVLRAVPVPGQPFLDEPGELRGDHLVDQRLELGAAGVDELLYALVDRGLIAHSGESTTIAGPEVRRADFGRQKLPAADVVHLSAIPDGNATV